MNETGLDVTTAEEMTRHAIGELSRDFEGIFSPETVERFVLDSLAAFPRPKVRNFIPLLVTRFAKERLRALAQAEGVVSKMVPEVLFVCVHNAGRSQMAAALLHRAAEGRIHVRSAGSSPADEIHDSVRRAMAEIGIDLSQEFPKPLTDEVVRAADVVITMGCGDACPVYPGTRYLDWELDDPAGADIEVARRIRDEIRTRVEQLVEELVVA